MFTLIISARHQLFGESPNPGRHRTHAVPTRQPNARRDRFFDRDVSRLASLVRIVAQNLNVDGFVFPEQSESDRDLFRFPFESKAQSFSQLSVALR